MVRCGMDAKQTARVLVVFIRRNSGEGKTIAREGDPKTQMGVELEKEILAYIKERFGSDEGISKYAARLYVLPVALYFFYRGRDEGFREGYEKGHEEAESCR